MIARSISMKIYPEKEFLPMSDHASVADTNAPFEIIRVNAKRVACDGGGGPLGHPRVWLHLGEEDQIACTYCSRLYVMEGSAADQALADHADIEGQD